MGAFNLNVCFLFLFSFIQRMRTAGLYQNVSMELGDLSLAARLQREVTLVSTLVYPPNHPMIGLQLFTLGDLLGVTVTLHFLFQHPTKKRVGLMRISKPLLRIR
jgi:hypothetical protein